MIIQNVDKYRVCEPLFEGVRIVLTHMGETFSPDYIQGISGAAFKIAGGCPSRPTCLYTMWTSDFIRSLGYEALEYPCVDENGMDVSDAMIEAVKHQIDLGNPALVWSAFTNLEWDVVCGYDNDQKQFIGRGSYISADEYAREAWNRAALAEFPFGAILIGDKKHAFDQKKAEIESLREAVRHARTVNDPNAYLEGVQFYEKWAADYAHEGRERDTADAYCYQVYSSARKAAVGYLREIAPRYNKAGDDLIKASGWFERESEQLDLAYPYISWISPWGVDEERSKKLAPILREAADCYEKGILCLEKALERIT
ncbi:MAG: hypothetical protein GX111_11170 [Clostridiales bacterium]|nr:hypothetical protein [Clostridiales bacterium]